MMLVMQALTAVLKEQGTSPAAVACHFDHSNLTGGRGDLGFRVTVVDPKFLTLIALTLMSLNLMTLNSMTLTSMTLTATTITFVALERASLDGADCWLRLHTITS